MKCDNCRIGRLRPTTLSYVEEIDGQILVIPNVPAYACDVCRQSMYDPGFLLNVENLLNKKEPPKRAKQWQSGVDHRVS
jgi:YgiT-type zinc finger domain-containing protein